MSVKMLHTCIRVMDLEKSLKFYKEALGLVETRRKDFPKHKFELGNGFSHTAIGSEDIEGLREKHIEMGYEVTDLKGLPGEKPHYYFVTDPDGYKVEVIRV